MHLAVLSLPRPLPASNFIGGSLGPVALASLVSNSAAMQPAILITGGSGYAGQFLSKHFAASGCQVRRRRSAGSWILLQPESSIVGADRARPSVPAPVPRESSPSLPQVGLLYRTAAPPNLPSNVQAFKVRLERAGNCLSRAACPTGGTGAVAAGGRQAATGQAATGQAATELALTGQQGHAACCMRCPASPKHTWTW